jgi:hypothetical protein
MLDHVSFLPQPDAGTLTFPITAIVCTGDTQFLYQVSPKLPCAAIFLSLPAAQWRYNVLWDKDLAFPWFGI